MTIRPQEWLPDDHTAARTSAGLTPSSGLGCSCGTESAAEIDHGPAVAARRALTRFSYSRRALRCAGTAVTPGRREAGSGRGAGGAPTARCSRAACVSLAAPYGHPVVFQDQVLPGGRLPVGRDPLVDRVRHRGPFRTTGDRALSVAKPCQRSPSDLTGSAPPLRPGMSGLIGPVGRLSSNDGGLKGSTHHPGRSRIGALR